MNRRNALGYLAGAAVAVLLVVELFGSATVGYSQAPTPNIKLTLVERTINALVIQGLTGTARSASQQLTAKASEAERNAIAATVQARIGLGQTATAVVISSTPTATINGTDLTQTLQAAVDERSTAVARDRAAGDLRGTALMLVYQTQTATAGAITATATPTISGVELTQTLRAAVDERSTAIARDRVAGDLRGTALMLVYQTQTATAGAITATATPTISGAELTQTLRAAVDERSTAIARDRVAGDLRATGLALVYQTQTATAGAVTPMPTPTISGVELTQTLQAAVDERSTAVARDRVAGDLRSTALMLVYQTQTATAGVVMATSTPTISPTPTLTRTATK